MDFEDFIKIILYGLLFGIIMICVSLLYTIPTYFLWNWLCPKLFGLPKITMWQSLGLLILTGLLFRSSITTNKRDD